MRAFLATVLTVIALGVMLIAYGLLAPQLAAAPVSVPTTQAGYMTAPRPGGWRSARYARPLTDDGIESSRRFVRVERAPRRDWKKTALVIGGSTAAGAGLGGIVGGGKGAAIGAAIGGGVSTLLSALK